MDGQRFLEELPSGSALFFAHSRYGSGACIRQSAIGICSKPFSCKSFSRVFGASAVKGILHIFNVIIV
jgi:hypothetical protein